MALRVVGAGLGRTGTPSLKVALERLLGGPFPRVNTREEFLARHAPGASAKPER